ELRVRPFMAGYGYSYVSGRYAITADVIAGYAWTSFTVSPRATEAYRDRLDASGLDASTHGTPVIKPELEVWYDLNRKFGLNLNAGYVVARPSVPLHSTLGDQTRRLRADMFMVKVGLVYSIF